MANTSSSSSSNNSDKGYLMFHECMNIKESSLGSFTDGCKLFVPGPPNTNQTFICQTCGCHRNYHRWVRMFDSQTPPPPPPEPVQDQTDDKINYWKTIFPLRPRLSPVLPHLNLTPKAPLSLFSEPYVPHDHQLARGDDSFKFEMEDLSIHRASDLEKPNNPNGASLKGKEAMKVPFSGRSFEGYENKGKKVMEVPFTGGSFEGHENKGKRAITQGLEPYSSFVLSGPTGKQPIVEVDGGNKVNPPIPPQSKGKGVQVEDGGNKQQFKDLGFFTDQDPFMTSISNKMATNTVDVQIEKMKEFTECFNSIILESGIDDDDHDDDVQPHDEVNLEYNVDTAMEDNSDDDANAGNYKKE